MGDPGPFAICSLGWMSSACSWTGHPHMPLGLDPHPLWALSGGSPGALTRYQATQVSSRSWGFWFGILELLIVLIPPT